jgi:hypothetical protein
MRPALIEDQRRLLRGRHDTSVPMLGAGAVGGVPILTQQFGDSLHLMVEIAWGADLNASSTTWGWSEVTTDVQVASNQNLSITVGRTDEHSTASPASCKFTLDNRLNKYSQSPLGSNWPNVKRSTPIRIRLLLDGIPFTLFEGNAVGFNPGWDVTGEYAITKVTANGLLRRLGQGNKPIQSAMRHYTPAVAGLLAYWPMEDDASAPALASALPDGRLMTYALGTDVVQPNSKFSLHQNSSFLCSDSIPVFNGMAYADVPLPVGTTNTAQVRMLVAWPQASSALPDGTVVMRAWSTGDIRSWELIYYTGGSLGVKAYDPAGTVLTDTGPLGYILNGLNLLVQVRMAANGSNTSGTLSTMGPGDFEPAENTFSVTGNIGNVTSVQLLPANVNTSVAIGHLSVQNQVTDIFDMIQPLSAFDGETAEDRATRLLGLVNIDPVAYSSDGLVTSVFMGPQRIDTVVNLLRECEQTEPGVLFDGLNGSLSFFSRTYLENQSASLTIDATSSDIAPSFDPADDDQLLRNRWTIQQRNGSSVVFEDTDGPLGTNMVGLFEDSATVNLNSNEVGSLGGAYGIKGLQERASWRVHENTVQGYRYPSLNLAFHHSPHLLDSWLNMGILGRVDITNIENAYTQMPAQTISLLIQGMTWNINKFVVSVAANCSSYDPWRVGVLAADSGDTGEFVMRLDTDDSVVAMNADIGAASISVTTASGPNWTTDSDDFPLLVDIDGIVVSVTNITGSGTTQIFTVDSSTVTKTLAAGVSVSVWRPTVLSL